tara:strand:- start:2906 stop:4180 length:1275 start_codon:yes stop_codon:yes gene_type:complete
MTNNIIKDKYTFFNINDLYENINERLLLPKINDKLIINDSRTIKDFKFQTFGGYSKKQVLKELDKSIQDSNVEKSIHWMMQLYFSGFIDSLWDKFMIISCKNININNPNLPIMMYNRHIKIKKILEDKKFSKDNILHLRNHEEIRNLLIEMLLYITLSKKKKLSTLPKIDKKDYILDNFKKKLQANSVEIITNIFVTEDPSEIRIAGNEMTNSLLKDDSHKALYWLNWILEWEKINTKKYGKYECGYRNVIGIESKLNRDVIWLIWNIIKKVKERKFGNGNTLINSNIDALWNLYIYKFSLGQKTKKINYILWSIEYLTNKIDWKIPIIDRPYILYQTMLNITSFIVNMKSQQINNKSHNYLLNNLVIQNNYLAPQNIDKMKKEKEREMKMKERKNIEAKAKKKKIDVDTFNKLEAFNKLASIS